MDDNGGSKNIGGEAMNDRDNKIIGLFRQILQNDLITDANGPADKDGFRLVFRHCQQWAIGDGSIEVSHITTSESHGYGMMILAHMAGCEKMLDFRPEQWICGCGSLRDYFNAMLRTVLAFPSVIGKENRLFAWELFGYPADGDDRTGYKQSDGFKTAPFSRDPETGDCATDGDMDIIYALLLADKKWGSGGAYDYKKIALDMLDSLWKTCVHKEYHTLLLGDWASDRAGSVLGDAVRLSDIIPGHIKAYAEADKAHDWQKVLDACYSVIRDLCEDNRHQNGLLPDFAVRADGKWKAPEEKILEGDDGAYSYNACRVPWRLGTDHSLLEIVIKPLNAFAKAYTGGDLDRLGPLRLDGTPLEESDPGTFTAPFLVTAAAGTDRDWENELWNWHGLDTYNGDNYGDYIKLLAMLDAAGMDFERTRS
jgi:endo-1,4-beta-D-glucanase Y